MLTLDIQNTSVCYFLSVIALMTHVLLSPEWAPKLDNHGNKWRLQMRHYILHISLHVIYSPCFFCGNTQRGWYHHWSVYQRLEWLSCKASILQVLLKLLSFFLLCFKVLALRETLSQRRESSLTWGTDEPANLSPDTQVSPGVVPNSSACSACKRQTESWKYEGAQSLIFQVGSGWIGLALSAVMLYGEKDGENPIIQEAS